MMFQPTKEQQELIDRAVAEPTKAALITAGLGTGKTLVAVEIAKSLEAKTVLVIAPRNTLKGWRKTFDRQQFPHPFNTIDSKNLEQFENLRLGVPGVYWVTSEFYSLSCTSTYDKDTQEIKRKARWSWGKTTPDLAIVDESHKGMAARWSTRSKALNQLKPNYRLMMSATPQGSKFPGIWAPAKWLWPDLVDGSKNRWEAVWCKRVFDPYARSGKKSVGERNPGEFLRSLPCVLHIEAQRVPVKEFDVKVSLSPVQDKMYQQMYKQSVSWLEENPLVAELPMVKKIRLRQMALGEVSFGEEDEILFADDCASTKIEAAKYIMNRHPGENILMVTDSAKFAEVVAKRLDGVAWTGDLKQKDRDRILDGHWPESGVVVATYGAIAEGSDGLQLKSHIEILFNKSTSVVLQEQFAGRLNRTGQPAEEIFHYEIMAKGTVDETDFDHMVREAHARREEIEL